MMKSSQFNEMQYGNEKGKRKLVSFVTVLKKSL